MVALARLLVSGDFPEATAGMESFLEIYEFKIGEFRSVVEHEMYSELARSAVQVTSWNCKFFFLEESFKCPFT